MKTSAFSFAASLMILSSSVASAGSLPTEYQCKSQASQFEYVVSLSKGTVREYDHRGQFLHTYENLQARLSPVLETFPPSYIIDMVENHGRGNVLVTLKIGVAGKGTAEFDDDETILCTGH